MAAYRRKHTRQLSAYYVHKDVRGAIADAKEQVVADAQTDQVERRGLQRAYRRDVERGEGGTYYVARPYRVNRSTHRRPHDNAVATVTLTIERGTIIFRRDEGCIRVRQLEWIPGEDVEEASSSCSRRRR